MRNRKFTPLGMQFALNITLIEAAYVKIDLIAGEAAQARHKNRHEVLHVAGMGHDAAHDQPHLSFYDAPQEQNNVTVFLKPTDK